MSFRLPKKSPEQRRVVRALRRKNVLVDSVAGSGKTTTVLHLAKKYAPQKMLMLTYSAKLKQEAREKAQKYPHLEIHSYHSFGVKYYHARCHTDQVLMKVIDFDLPTQRQFDYEILILDEIQDMTFLYYQFVHKILEKLNSPKICILGDQHQSIFQFNGSDARYITLAPTIFQFANPFSWKRLSLTTSFRMTHPIGKFINQVMLREDRIQTLKDGSPVRYIIADCFGQVMGTSDRIYQEFQYYRQQGYSYEEMFILAPSVKSDASPVRQFANRLTQEGIPVYVPLTDSEKLDPEVLQKKVVFSTFHQVKGLERKVIMVFNFDSSYFHFYKRDFDPTVCPNELYVATTRAQEQLTLFHHYQNDYLPFLQRDKLDELCEVEKCPLMKADFGVRDSLKCSVTDLIKFLPAPSLRKALDFLTVETIQESKKKIEIETKIQEGELFENVSELTGLAIPAYYQFATQGKMSICEGETPAEIDPPMLLQLANRWNAKKTRFNYKLSQITRYEWLPGKQLRKCVRRLKKEIGPKAYYEVKVSQHNRNREYPELYNRHLVGMIDVIDGKRVWELKCVQELQEEHLLQLGVYMYLHQQRLKRPQDYEYYLFNILDQKKVRVSASPENLRGMIQYLIQEKFFTNRVVNDDQFVSSLKEYRSFRETLEDQSQLDPGASLTMVVDIETDGNHQNQFIVQIAYNLYDDQLNLIQEESLIINDGRNLRDYYRRIPMKLIREGLKPDVAFQKFNADLKKCRYVVGHNLENFDLWWIRHNMNKRYLPMAQGYEVICTMKSSKQYVQAKSKIGRLKNPRLDELYQKLFGQLPDSSQQHEASYDVDLTYRCLVELIKKEVIQMA